MNELRIGQRSDPLEFYFDGRRIEAFAGDSVSSALWAHGIRGWEGGRVFFCAMGVCQQCAVWIGDARVEACRTPVRDGMRVRSRP